jgi:hypothetical protein
MGQHFPMRERESFEKPTVVAETIMALFRNVDRGQFYKIARALGNCSACLLK